MKYQHRVLGMLSLLSVITYLDRVCIAVAGPRMQDELQVSPEAWGWVTSIFFLSYSAFIPMVALLSLGALLWLQADPTRELFPEEHLAQV
jgi:MFS transporter, ACS family, glucarate transporter